MMQSWLVFRDYRWSKSRFHLGCSKGPCVEGTIENTLPEKGILTKQGTYIMAILGTGILNNYHLGKPALIRISAHEHTEVSTCGLLNVMPKQLTILNRKESPHEVWEKFSGGPRGTQKAVLCSLLFRAFRCSVSALLFFRTGQKFVLFRTILVDPLGGKFIKFP